MKLAKIKLILEILVEAKVIDSEKQSVIDNKIKTAKEKGQALFAGQVGINLGYFDKATFDKYLLEQTISKLKACVEDISTIRAQKKQTVPEWLIPNWGNNGVNKVILNPTVADAISAIANIAQNITLIANQHPHVIDSSLINTITSAALIADRLKNCKDNKPVLHPLDFHSIKNLKSALENIVKQTSYTPVDRRGQAIDIKDFIKNRFYEIQQVVNNYSHSLPRHAPKNSNNQRKAIIRHLNLYITEPNQNVKNANFAIVLDKCSEHKRFCAKNDISYTINRSSPLYRFFMDCNESTLARYIDKRNSQPKTDQIKFDIKKIIEHSPPELLVKFCRIAEAIEKRQDPKNRGILKWIGDAINIVLNFFAYYNFVSDRKLEAILKELPQYIVDPKEHNLNAPQAQHEKSAMGNKIKKFTDYANRIETANAIGI